LKTTPSIERTLDVIMNAEDSRHTFLPGILNMLSHVYGSAVKIRKFGYHNNLIKPDTLPCYVMSIGNITVGGTGKTPLAIYMAKLFKDMGYKVAIISRGYKGGAEKKGGIVSNGDSLLLDADRAGDEPYLIACELKGIPVIVGSNRIKAGRLAIKEFHPDVIILDDGFQHIKLFRNLDIVLLDTAHPFGNGHLLPRGTLREPVDALARGDIFILSRSDTVDGETRIKTIETINTLVHPKPVFQAVHVPYIKRVIKQDDAYRETGRIDAAYDDNFLNHRKVVAFSGIAKNHVFEETLKQFGCFPLKIFSYGDHHQYKKKHMEDMVSFAKKHTADFIVTTEKDYVKIKNHTRTGMNLIVLDTRISFGEQRDQFHELIRDRIQTFYSSFFNGEITRLGNKER